MKIQDSEFEIHNRTLVIGYWVFVIGGSKIDHISWVLIIHRQSSIIHHQSSITYHQYFYYLRFL